MKQLHNLTPYLKPLFLGYIITSFFIYALSFLFPDKGAFFNDYSNYSLIMMETLLCFSLKFVIFATIYKKCKSLDLKTIIQTLCIAETVRILLTSVFLIYSYQSVFQEKSYAISNLLVFIFLEIFQSAFFIYFFYEYFKKKNTVLSDH